MATRVRSLGTDVASPERSAAPETRPVPRQEVPAVREGSAQFRAF